MSFSDSESSSHGGDYKFFRQISRDRLLDEMLGSTKTGDSKAWKILIMDRVTVKVMSQSCKMADITDQGISLVEELFKRREPMPGMDAIYFIQPTKENIVMFLSDMSGREPLYRKAFIFFSSTIPKELVNHIKSDSSVLPRIGALREMNMEYFPIDNQGFLTDHEQALETLYAEDAENSRHFNICLNMMATRISTVFASLKDLWETEALPRCLCVLLFSHTYNHIYGLSLTGLRFFTVYGPWGRPDMAYFFFTRDILKGKPISVFQGANHRTVARDFTYIDDIVKGCLGALDTAEKSTGSGGKKHGAAQLRVFNLGNTSPVPVTHLVSILERLLKVKAKRNMMKLPKNGDVQFTHANITSAQRELGYKPTTDLQAGLKKFVRWYLGYYKGGKKVAA